MTIELEPSVISRRTWNSGIVPHIESGELKDCSDELPEGVLKGDQLMRALLRDSKGQMWHCAAYADETVRITLHQTS